MPSRVVFLAFMLMSVTTVLGAPVNPQPVAVLSVDAVGVQPGLPPAADLLSVVLFEDEEGAPWLRIGLLSLADDQATAQVLGRRDKPFPESVTLNLAFNGRAATEIQLNRSLDGYHPQGSTARRQGDGLWLPVDPALAEAPLDLIISTTAEETIHATYPVPGGRDYRANCAFVLHGNQGLGYTNVFIGESDNLEGSGFDEALQIHDATGVHGNFHVSGTLQTTAQWQANNGDPLDFNGLLSNGVSAGWAGLLTSAYAQHIMPFVHDEMNNWAVDIETQMTHQRYGQFPTVAWVPERVWLNTSGYPSDGVNDWIGDNWEIHGVQAVILDDAPHLAGHDKHQIHTLSGTGLRLIPRDRDFTGNIIGGNGQAALNILTDMAGSGLGAYRIAVMAEDWEAVAEVGGWATDTPNAKETYDWFVNKCYEEFAWIFTWKLADALAEEPFIGDTFTPFPGTYYEIGGTHGYGGNNNAWYTDWAGYIPYANGGIDGECAGTGGNCKDYGTLWNDAYNALMAAPDNDLSLAGWYILMTNLYETAWHDGLGGQISGWENNYSAHIKNANVYAEAAGWAAGQYAATTAAYFSDIDNDGYDELVMHSDRLFAVFESTGGRCTWLFTKYGATSDTAIGIDNAYWEGTDADYNDANHVGAFSDVGPNYQHSPYQLEIVDGDAGDGAVTIRASYLEVSKEITLRTGEPWLDAVYRVGATAHWIQAGWSPSLVDLVWNADMERVWAGFSYAYMGHHNPNTSQTVAWVLGQGEAGHQKEIAATLMKGDELVADGTFQVKLFAGTTSAPVDGQVPELQALASALTDTIGPRVDWATWHPALGRLRIFFDQPITDTTADETLMGFDDDGDGVPEIELDGIATPAPIGSVWYVQVSVDPAQLDAINALDQDNLRIVLEPGAIEDWHQNTNPFTTGPVTVVEPLRVTIDGLFEADEWSNYYLDDENDSAWTSDNEIEAVHVTWDDIYLYIGIEGIIENNSWILYLDINPGSGIGETDLTEIDVWERGATFSAPGFAADWQYAAYQHQSPDDTQGLWKIESATETANATGNAIMAFDPEHLYGTDGGSEMAIPWSTLYGLGAGEVPPGAEIALVASLCWDPEPDGELGGDSAPSNLGAILPELDHVWNITVDANGDGAPDRLGAAPAPDPRPTGLSMYHTRTLLGEDVLQFNIPGSGQTPASLKIFDLRGRRVATLLNESVPTGSGRMIWNRRDDNGRQVASGLYLARLQVNGSAVTSKVVIVR